MLGIRSVSGLAFYDWETTDLVRRIEITPKNVSAYKLLFTCEKNNTRSEWISRILSDIFQKPDIVCNFACNLSIKWCNIADKVNVCCNILLEPRHEKTNVLVSDLVLHKPGCTATEHG